MENTNKIIEIDISKITDLENEEVDNSVGYYVPFCIFAENEQKEQINLYLDYDTLIDLALKLKPYLEDYQSQIDFDTEQYNHFIEDNI